MIRKERAIQILEQRACCMECVVENCACAECDEAFDMAIQALEQEPNTEKIIKMRDATPEERESIDKYVKSISKITGVDFWNLAPKTGHWEYGYAFPDGNYCKCSECKEIIKCIYPMHYCPNCGAKMEGEQND